HDSLRHSSQLVQVSIEGRRSNVLRNVTDALEGPELLTRDLVHLSPARRARAVCHPDLRLGVALEVIGVDLHMVAEAGLADRLDHLSFPGLIALPCAIRDHLGFRLGRHQSMSVRMWNPFSVSCAA